MKSNDILQILEHIKQKNKYFGDGKNQTLFNVVFIEGVRIVEQCSSGNGRKGTILVRAIPFKNVGGLGKFFDPSPPTHFDFMNPVLPSFY